MTLAGYRWDIEQFAACYASQNERARSVGDPTTLDIRGWKEALLRGWGQILYGLTQRLGSAPAA